MIWIGDVSHRGETGIVALPTIIIVHVATTFKTVSSRRGRVSSRTHGEIAVPACSPAEYRGPRDGRSPASARGPSPRDPDLRPRGLRGICRARHPAAAHAHPRRRYLAGAGAGRRRSV